VGEFVDWSVRAYGAPTATERCLEMQDEHGQSVCLLLWAGWLAAKSATPATGALSNAIEITRTWEHEVIAPLRAARRALKTAPQIPDAAREVVRRMAKQAELAAEIALLGALEALPTETSATPPSPVDVLTAICAAWGEPAPREKLAALAAAFPMR
jgi:uncharacterized protein (TIGR02444 family)